MTYHSFFQDTSFKHEGSMTFPGYWGVGATFQIRPNISVGLDYTQQDWTVLAINDEIIQNSRKSGRISLGSEFTLGTKSSDPYWKRMFYRIGYSTQPHFSQDSDGNAINEQWFTMGFGLPLLGRKTQIDIALNYGIRGSLETNGITEKLFRISLSLTGGERWFVRTIK